MLKSLPLAVMALLLFSSCSTYQYTTLSSSNMPMNDKQEFEFENDSIRLTYNFNGYSGPVQITLQNKLQVPIYIDWQKSAIIKDGQAVTYAPKEVKIEGGVQSSSSTVGSGRSAYGISSGNISAVASLPPSVDFIPPQSFFTHNPMGLQQGFINVSESDFHKVKYAPAEGYDEPVKAAVFTEGASPLRFRSYLTIMVGEVTAKPVGFEHSFFVSQVMASGRAPGVIWMNKNNQGNQFYVSKTSNGGAAIGAIIGLAVVSAVFVAAGNSASGDTGN